MHPDRRESGRAWIRGKALGEAYTKEAIISGLGKSFDRDRRIKDCSEAERLEYYGKLYREIFGYHTSSEGDGAIELSELDARERADVTDAIPGSELERASEADIGADGAASENERGSRENNRAAGATSPGAHGEDTEGFDGGIRKGGTRI